MNKPKAAVYCRVSTESLEQDGSYEAQKRYFTEKYKDRFDIIEVYAEKKSGTNIKNRDEFQRLLKDAGLELEHKRGNINLYNTIREPKFNYIIVKSVSRFSRNTETISIIRKLKTQGVYIIYDDINKTTESEEDEMLLGIMLQMAQQESVEKSRIVRWGIKRSAEANMIRMSSIPFGYERAPQENRLIINKKEAEIVKYVFDLYVNKDKGVRIIRQMLDEKGYKNREGKSFTERSLLYMVQNCKYCGINLNNRFSSNDLYNKSSRVELPESEWVKMKNDRIPVIIDDELFDKAQRKLESRRTNGKGMNSYKSPYAGKINCECGGTYIHNKFTSKNRNNVGFYVCNRRKKIGKAASGCNSRNIPDEEIENAIDEYMNGRMKEELNDKLLFCKNIIKLKKQEIENTDISNVENKLKEINNLINENKNKLDNLIDLLFEASESKKELVENRMEKVEAELKSLEYEKKNLTNIVNNKNESLDKLDKFQSIIMKCYSDMDGNITKEEFIEKIVRIYINSDNKIEIYTHELATLDALQFIVLQFDIEKSILENIDDTAHELRKRILKKYNGTM